MGGVAGKRTSAGAGLDPARPGAASANPGKSTLTGALDGSDAGRHTPRDVSPIARSEIGGAFGARGQTIDYAAGGGDAESRGANAVTVGGKVDFAPGMFDLDSRQGRARLGEETAHAIQQSTAGPPASVDALEGEAKRAGADFADGRRPTAALAAPAGLALADDTRGDKDAQNAVPKDSDPSREVPDLKHGEVTAIQQVLASDPDKALALLLAAMQGLNATLFKSDDLSNNKLEAATGRGPSVTRQGRDFRAWLAAELDRVAGDKGKAKEDLSAKEVKDVWQNAKPPRKDIQVRIGLGFFTSVPQLYSTVRHEFVHVEQLRNNYLGILLDQVLPPRVKVPDIGGKAADLEIDPYLWEMEHLANTGLKDPADLNSLLVSGDEKLGEASKPVQSANRGRFETAYQAVWKKSMDETIAGTADEHKQFTTGGKVGDAARVRKLDESLGLLWKNKDKHKNKPDGYAAGHKTAAAQIAELIAASKAEAFGKLLDTVDTEVASGYRRGLTAYERWQGVTAAWNGLDSKAKAAIKARYDTAAPALWTKVFEALEAEIQDYVSRGDVGAADETMSNSVAPLFKNAYATVKTESFEGRRKALKTAIAEAKKARSK